MSYYTYFKLKDDSSYKDTTIEECKKRCKGDHMPFYSDDFKSMLITSMVAAYYETDVKKKRDTIAYYICMMYSKYYNEYEYVKSILEDEHKVYWINHCKEEYDMRYDVDYFDDFIKETITDLTVLATVRFEPDDKYSDTPKTTSEYLRYEYVNEINEKLSYADEVYEDYKRNRFLLEHCDRLGGEDSEEVEKYFNALKSNEGKDTEG